MSHDATAHHPPTRRRRAVVTGASSGIGAATVAALAADGWDTVAVARRADRLAGVAERTGAQVVVADLTSDDDVARLVDEVVASGPVDALVNVAGGALGTDPVAEADIDQWRRMYELNVLGTFRTVQRLLPALREAEGSIVVVTSTAAHEPYEGGGGYVAAKFAERVATRTLRLELVGEPVRVIDIAPGMVKTEEFSLVRYGGDQARADAVYAGVPGPLLAEDVAEAVRWTLSLPPHVNVDELVVRPRAQGSPTKLDRRA
ncbi:SDR family oxidoreductase [Luteimicrobium subarcticum]|uniref:NADP-dependent 3-hydroxy acid dehydrogenase YdfG n=1 Tax=Luteimicrobium subarcticum TaxID=620910 RepID=A0A2M8WU90_9MICO|nr:SDR family oxidoreductase [Luteimicrobium subarcticum]PJI94459.1 NADP-dependent 3-hydroxy acid dehydrogenase YdfG [Luteimicrobium subarcticum]